MNERLVDIHPDMLADGIEIRRTTVEQGEWCNHIPNAPGFKAPYRSDVTYQRVERDPELPTKSGAVIWAALRNRCKPLALQLGDRIWHGTDGCRYAAYEITHVLAVLRDPGADQ